MIDQISLSLVSQQHFFLVRVRSIRNCWHQFPLAHTWTNSLSLAQKQDPFNEASPNFHSQGGSVHPERLSKKSLLLLHSNYVLLSFRISFIFPLIVSRADSHKINITIAGDSTVLFSISCSSTMLAHFGLFSILHSGKSQHFNFLAQPNSVFKFGSGKKQKSKLEL